MKMKIIDKVNHRSSHIGEATRSGGSVFFLLISFYTFYLYYAEFQPYDFTLLIPISILFVTGLYDDIYGVDFGLKFIFQIITAKLMIDMGLVIDIFSIFGLEFSFSRLLSQIITIIFYMSIFNAFNFIDGIDGNLILESLKNLIIILFLFDFSESMQEFALICFIILLVILFFNLNKKLKIFMGDSGSLILPIILIYFVFYGVEINDDHNIVKYLLLIFIYPIIDLARIIIVRLINKKSPFIADKNHIHHLVNNNFKKHFLSSVIICSCVGIIQLIIILALL